MSKILRQKNPTLTKSNDNNDLTSDANIPNFEEIFSDNAIKSFMTDFVNYQIKHGQVLSFLDCFDSFLAVGIW